MYVTTKEELITILTCLAEDIKTDNLCEGSYIHLSDELTSILDDMDEDDSFGTEGWRHRYLGE